MVKSCCVPFCRSRKTKDCQLLFHSFPVNKSLCKQWLEAVQQYTRKSPRNCNPLVVKEHTKVCSSHFLKTDYWYAGTVLKLRKHVVPTIFTPPKEKDNAIVSSTSKEEREQNKDTVLMEDELVSEDHIVKNDIKHVSVQILSKKLKDSEKSKRKNIKGNKYLKNPEMVQNCKNLLLINSDHPYAALWQNESLESGNDSSSEDADNDEAEIPTTTNATEDATATYTNLHIQEKSAVTLETVVEEMESISLNENNTETCSNTETSNNTETCNITETSSNAETFSNTENKTDLVNTDTHKTIESIYLKEEVIEEFSENIEKTNICISINSMQDTRSENDSVSCNRLVEKQSISTIASSTRNKNIENDNVLHTKPSKRINAISKKNLPEICILCATANMTRKNYTLIIHFADMIKDLSGVDILKSNVAPIACNVCFKNVLEMWNFKQQIITADKFIREKIPKQPSTYTNSGNVPKPTANTFEYIDYNKQNLNNAAINIESHRQVENVGDLDQQTLQQKNNQLLCNVKDKPNTIRALPKSKNDLQKKDKAITLVLIEDILKENNAAVDDDEDGYNDIDCESSEDCPDLPTCTVCGNAFSNNTKTCKCEESVTKKETRPEKFVCSICGKQYPLLRSLRRHEITHKAKKYLCSVCGKVFHFRLYLKRHMRKHSGKKPFACPYCNKKFSSQWNLSQHKRLHTNSLPYECQLCPTAFRHNVTLKKHIRLFHTADEFMRNCQRSTSSASPIEAQN